MKSPIILLVEDEARVRKLFASFLEGAGYRVLQAATGIEALQAAQTQPLDLVISDVFMPAMDGYELVRRLRAKPLFLPIPIILYSGIFADEAASHLAEGFGIRHFLAKPFSKETFLNSVADALRRGEVRLSPPTEQLEREHNRVLIDKLTEKVKALAASEERFRQLAENITDVFWLSDPANTKIFYVSPAYEMIWGRSCESLYASPCSWADAIHPEDRPRVPEGEARHSVAGGHEHTYRIIRPDGGMRWIHDRAFPVRDESGQLIRVAGLASDITNQKKAQREVAVRARQQQMVAELGHRALANVSLTALFDQTVILVARALEVEFCKVLELLPDQSGLKLVAGVGWHEGLVGQAVVGTGLDSQAGYTLHCENPVIVDDLRTETRFRVLPNDLGGARVLSSSDFLGCSPMSGLDGVSPHRSGAPDPIEHRVNLLYDHGLVSGVSVMIGSPENPWGVLGAHSPSKRTFTKDDITFVQSVANVLGAAIARKENEQSLLDLSIRLMRAEDAERRRIAKELHDSTAQDLVAVMMNLESVRNAVAARDPAEATQLEDSLALLENCAHEIRTLAYILHPPRLDEAGLGGAIRQYAAGFGERTGIATGVELPVNLDRLGETAEMILFRVVQECLGNIHRHACSPTASVRLKHDASGIVLEVRDEGRGIAPQILEAKTAHFTGLGVGISGMRERLRQIGGRLEIDSNPCGTTVRAVVPGHEPRRADILSAGSGGILPHGPRGRDAP